MKINVKMLMHLCISWSCCVQCYFTGDDYGQQNGSHVDGASPWL